MRVRKTMTPQVQSWAARKQMRPPARSFAAGLFVLLWLAAAGSAQADRPRPRLDEAPLRPLMSEGVAALKAGKAAEAVAIFERIDQSFSAAYRQGPRVFCSRSPKESLLYLETSAAEKGGAIAISPLWCDAIYLRAYGLVELGRAAEAANELDRVLKLAPHNAQYLNERAELLMRARAFDAALGMFRQAEQDASLSPDPQAARTMQSRGCRGIGYTLVELGRLDEADATYRRCLTIDPKDRKSILELGFIAQKKAGRR